MMTGTIIPARRSGDRRPDLAPSGQLAHDDLALDLHPDDEEEDHHQTVVDPLLQPAFKVEEPDVDGDVVMDEVFVEVGERRVGGDQREQHRADDHDATGGLGTAELLEGADEADDARAPLGPRMVQRHVVDRLAHGIGIASALAGEAVDALAAVAAHDDAAPALERAQRRGEMRGLDIGDALREVGLALVLALCEGLEDLLFQFLGDDRHAVLPDSSRRLRTVCRARGARSSGAGRVRAPAGGWRPREDSNLRTGIRNPMLCPLSYEGAPSNLCRSGLGRTVWDYDRDAKAEAINLTDKQNPASPRGSGGED